MGVSEKMSILPIGILIILGRGILLSYAMPIEIQEIHPANPNEQDHPKLTVKISKGASVTPMDDVTVYTSIQHLIFTLPDLPEPPRVSEPECGKSLQGTESCVLFKNLQTAIKDVNEVLTIHNRVLTTRGGKTVDPEYVEIPKKWLNVVKDVNVRSNPPSEDITALVPQDWLSDTEAQLLLRKILLNETIPHYNAREKRWLKSIASPVLKLMGAGFAIDHLDDLFDNLFVGDNSILSYLTGFKLITKDEYKVFADLPSSVSELQVETKKLFKELLNSTENVKTLSHNVQQLLKNNDDIMATVEDTFFLEQSTLSDIVSNLYTAVTYNLHFSAYDECRSFQIPTAFVPAGLLQKRLEEVEKALPANVKLAIPLDKIQHYYKQPIADCVYDSNGGIVRIAIPLVEKDAKLTLYKFQPHDFAHGASTCSVRATSTFVVKEHNTNQVTVISHVDDHTCNPDQGLCLLPFSQSEGSNNFCLETLLSKEPAHIVKENCDLDCRLDTRPTLSQLTPSTFVGIHLPASIRIQCPTTVLTVNEEVVEGAIHMYVPCGCEIWTGKKLLGKSSAKSCEPSDKPEVEILLPVQMTRFMDILPFTTSEGNENTAFSDIQEIFNPNFNSDKLLPFDDDYDHVFIGTSYAWTFLHSCFLLYLYLRVNVLAGGAAAVLTFSGGLPVAEAAGRSSAPDCVLPPLAYYLLLANLLLAAFAVIPNLGIKILKKIKKAYNKNVRLAANKIVFEEAQV